MTTSEMGAIRPGQEQRPDARQDKRLDWWREARFGMFIHWGIYAVLAGRWRGKTTPGRNGNRPLGEWIQFVERIPVSEYESLASQFNPTKFDANAWVSLAKRAGQKYLVITAKHHDGFCMFDSQFTGYDIVNASPFGRDPMKELSRACEEQGITFCFYYSQTQDWHHPDGDGNDWDYDNAQKEFAGYIEDYVKPQVRELLTNYGPIGLIWFDTPKRITAEQSQSLVDFVHELQPDCLVNGRIGNGLGITLRQVTIPFHRPCLQLIGKPQRPSMTLGATWSTTTTGNSLKSLSRSWLTSSARAATTYSMLDRPPRV